MTQQFENFVNAALDKSLASDVTLPTADDIPVFTGIGRQVTGKTTAELGLATSSQLTDKADLVDGLVPANQLPGYVDDVLEYANLASFPLLGEASKLYIAIDTDLVYRWSGSTYAVTSSSLALGETSTTAYRGDRGKIAYDHSQATGNPHNLPSANTSTDGYLTSTDWNTFNGKQAALVSSTNIKTVNGNSLLGNGDLIVTDPEAVQRGTGNTVNATSEVVNCTDVTVNGANCTVSNSAKLIVTGDNLNINGLRFNTVKILTFPQGSNIIGHALGSTGTYITVSSGFQKTKNTSSTVVLSDAASIKPYIGFYTYGSYQDVAYHRVTVMGTLNDNNYAVFAVATRKDTSVIVTTIQAGGGYITLAAADDGAGRLILTVGTTYSSQDTITAYVESYYGRN